MPGIEMSSSRQRVSLMLSDARNASADENARAQKPNCRSRSGSDSRTDSSSSTTDTSERVSITERPQKRLFPRSARSSPHLHLEASLDASRQDHPSEDVKRL